MIVDRIEKYLRTLGESKVSPELVAKHEGLRREIEALAGYTFKRQFLSDNESSGKGKLRLSACGKCARQQAYSYHGFPKKGKEMDGRSRLTFFAGDLTELIIVALAKLAGCTLTATGLNQIPVWFKVKDTHVEGHPDGLILANGKLSLLEVKSASSFGFSKFQRSGPDESYLAQCNMYMAAMGLEGCWMVYLCKDNGVLDERYISLDPSLVTYCENKMAMVMESTPENLPPQEYVPDEKGFLPWQCRYCFAYGHCWPEAKKVLVKKSYKLKVPQSDES